MLERGSADRGRAWMSSSDLPNWTRWPEGETGYPVLSIQIDKAVDDVFLLLYGSSTDFTVG